MALCFICRIRFAFWAQIHRSNIYDIFGLALKFFTVHITLSLRVKGYRCIPVNERAAARGESILGVPAVARTSDIAEKVDIVDIFLRSDRIGPVIDDAINAG
jgi:hypothetical protein